ncbi:iron-containing alcohol dehydrogenase [Hungatella sp.]|uniref:iron-containing alcohol dehydrogenase n=1 Tax=Hungatella sp. TaxID=2613924 RepID=UPI003AB90FFF
MQEEYQLKLPGEIYAGSNALNNIKKVLGKRIKRVALFTDKGVENSGLLNKVKTILSESGVEMVIFHELPSEPTCDQVQETAERFRESGAEYIIAVGGGSVMDSAKLASVLSTGDYGVRSLLEEPGLARKGVPTLMIPTTAGTGAEATPNSIVAVPEKHLKIGIVSDEMIADAVILDGEMIRGLPRTIAASTGVDALCHAIECYTSQKANPFSNLFALEALDLILNNIEEACDNKNALEEKNRMLLGAFYGGVAITASGTTAVHALSYPLGGRYHIAHGVSNAVLLLPVMRFNEPVCRKQFAEIYDRCVHGKKLLEGEEEKSAYILAWLEEIVSHLEIPLHLSEFGVPASDLDTLTESGMEVTRLLNNNLRTLTYEDARELYRTIL